MNRGREQARLVLLMAPAVAVFGAFFLLPLGRLALVSAAGERGLGTYALILTNSRYLESLISTILLSALSRRPP
jgi:putative spermidine/putrescine transport system permease protein